MEKSLKGAAFIAASMSACQAERLDMLMYYDARPSAMNGLFCTDFICDRLKGYYPFYMFNTLYALKNAVPVQAVAPLYCSAARNGGKAAVMLTHFEDDDAAAAQQVCLALKGLNAGGGVRAKYYLLDQEHDMDLMREETFTGENCTAVLNMPNFSTVLVELEEL